MRGSSLRSRWQVSILAGAVGVACLGLALSAQAQTPAGGEFVINTYTTGDQSYAAVAAAPGGDLLVVWTS